MNNYLLNLKEEIKDGKCEMENGRCAYTEFRSFKKIIRHQESGIWYQVSSINATKYLLPFAVPFFLCLY